MHEQYEASAKRYLQRLEGVVHDQSPSLRVCEGLLDEFLAVSEAPAPDARMRVYFCNAHILANLAEALFVPGAISLLEAIDQVSRAYRQRHSHRYLRVRQLGALGRYPNQEFADRWGRYTIRMGTPYLITFNSALEEAHWSNGSELSDWTRHETRFAATFSCTETGDFSPYLTHRVQDIPSSAVGHVPRTSRVDFMIEYASLVGYVRNRNDRSRMSSANELNPPFVFGDFTRSRTSARAFATKFLVSHLLLLRTARYYVKAMMLWHTRGLEEDAVANVFFSLEGCLLLFQEIHGARNDKLDRKLLRNLFADVYDHGAGLYDYIDDAMGWGGTRARIVHPQLALMDGWTPNLSAEHYFEYKRIVSALLMYIVTGTTFFDYELQGG